MKNAHIAFVSVPIASHLNQTLPLVTTLTRRGHRVSYAVAEPFRARVEAAGAEPIVLHLDAMTAQADEIAFCRIATHTLPRIRRWYENDRPAVIVYDFTALAGRVVARRANVPAIRATPHFAMSGAALELQIPDTRFREQVLAISAKADEFLRHHEVDANGFLFHREELNIHWFPREFEPCEDALDDTCFHAGRCAGEQISFGQWNARNSCGKPIVLVAPSNSYLQGSDYFRACVEAFAGSPWHVVLSIGESDSTAAAGELPEGFEIVQRTSHTKILPHASLVLCMGGMATAAEAAYHGVPMIVTSRGHAELAWLGDNFARLGVAVHMREAQPTPEALRRTAHELLANGKLLANVQRLQSSVRRSAGAEETANRIEDYIHEASR